MTTDAERNNRIEAWQALAMIREAVETLGPIGCMRSSEYVACHIEPTFTAEATEIVNAIILMNSRK